MNNKTTELETSTYQGQSARPALLGCVLPDRAFTKVGDEMTWPSYNDAVSDVEWKLRYNPESMTRHDQLVAASVIAAYRQMIGDPQKKRNAVCKALREAI